jgi:hypothetical protein
MEGIPQSFVVSTLTCAIQVNWAVDEETSQNPQLTNTIREISGFTKQEILIFRSKFFCHEMPSHLPVSIKVRSINQSKANHWTAGCDGLYEII